MMLSIFEKLDGIQFSAPPAEHPRWPQVLDEARTYMFEGEEKEEVEADSPRRLKERSRINPNIFFGAEELRGVRNWRAQHYMPEPNWKVQWFIIIALLVVFLAGVMLVPSRPWNEKFIRKFDEIMQPRRQNY